MHLTQSKNLYTVAQAADYIGVSPNSLRRWDAVGTFSAMRTPGGQRRYTQIQLDEFFNQKKSTPVSPQPSSDIHSEIQRLIDEASHHFHTSHVPNQQTEHIHSAHLGEIAHHFGRIMPTPSPTKPLKAKTWSRLPIQPKHNRKHTKSLSD